MTPQNHEATISHTFAFTKMLLNTQISINHLGKKKVSQ